MAELKPDNIFLEISIQKLQDETIVDYLKERLNEFTEITNIPVELEYGGIRKPLWEPLNRYKVIDDTVPNIISISGLWIPKEIRGEKLGSNIVATILDALGADTLIFAEAGVLKKEYPEEEYSLEEVEGKTKIDVEEVISGVQHFYATVGFIDMSDLLPTNDIKKIMIAGIPLGAYAREYIAATNIVRNTVCYEAISNIYTKAFKSIIQMYNDDNVFFYPYIGAVSEDDKLPKLYSGDLTGEWLSSYKAEDPSDIEKLVIRCADINRNFLTPLGGSEVRCTINDFIIGPNAVLFKPNNVTDTISHESITYSGYALFKNGLWEPWIWYYDVWEGEICNPSDARNDICLYIGIAINIPDEFEI